MDNRPQYDRGIYNYSSKHRIDLHNDLNKNVSADWVDRTLHATGLHRLWKKYVGCNITRNKTDTQQSACHHLNKAYLDPINTWLGRGLRLKTEVFPPSERDEERAYWAREAARKEHENQHPPEVDEEAEKQKREQEEAEDLKWKKEVARRHANLRETVRRVFPRDPEARKGGTRRARNRCSARRRGRRRPPASCKR